MVKSQSRTSRTKETSGTRGRSNTSKTSSRGSSNRRSAARVADNSAGQMQMAQGSRMTSKKTKPRGKAAKKTAR